MSDKSKSADAFDALIKEILYDNHVETNKKKKLTEEEMNDYLSQLISVYISPLHYKRTK